MRSAPGRSSSTARASAKRLFGLVTSARTRSPVRPREPKTAEPLPRATPRPPRASESISTSTTSPRRGRVAVWPPASTQRPLIQFLARAPRRLGRLFAHRRGSSADLFAGLFDQPFELFKHAVGLPAAALDQVGDHPLGVAAGHPPPLDRVVDDLLQAIAAQGDAVFEALAEVPDALVEAGSATRVGRFLRRFRFFGGGFASGRFFGARPGFRVFRRFAGRLFFRGHAQLPPISLLVLTVKLHLPALYAGKENFAAVDYLITLGWVGRNVPRPGCDRKGAAPGRPRAAPVARPATDEEARLRRDPARADGQSRLGRSERRGRSARAARRTGRDSRQASS